MPAITFDFLSRGAPSLARDISSVGNASGLASRGTAVLADVIEKLGAKENRTAAESVTLAAALRQTGEAEDRAAAKAVLADAAIRRLDDAMKEAAKKPLVPQVQSAAALRKLTEIRVAAEELKRNFPEFTARIDDRAAKLKLAALAVEAQAVDDAINRGFGGAGSGRGGILSRLGGGAGGGGLPGGPLLALGAPAAALGAALVPGAAGLGIGGAAGLGAIGGGLFGAEQGKKILTADQATIKQITTGLKTAIGQQKADLSAALKDAEAQYARDAAFYAPFTAFQASLQGLAKTLLVPLRTVMAPLTGIFTEFGKGLTVLGPVLAQTFRASLPFVQVFANLMLTAGKTLLPAFTGAMQQMVKSGALAQMSQGLVIIVNGLAGFITALGPGMRSSAVIFKGLAEVIAAVLRGLGLAFAYMANTFADNAHSIRLTIHDIASVFDDFRHRAAVIFDGIRHDIAHVWDMIWNNTIGRIGRGVADVAAWWRNLQAGAAAAFSALRTAIAAAWNTIWANTVTRVTTGIGDVVRFFTGLPGKIVTALGTAGTVLYSWGKGVIQGMLNGFTAIWTSVVNFFTGLPKKILGWLGIKSPPDWAIQAGKDIMHGLGIGMDFARGVVSKATAAAIGAASGVAPGRGPVSADAAAAQRYAASRLPAYGWGLDQMPALFSLWMGESGWNRFAYNASSGATGIPQALPYSKMPRAAWLPSQGGQASAAAQIDWGLGYIKGRPDYGSPSRAYALWLSRSPHWYDRGGWLMPGVTLAVNSTGRPEQVIPGEGLDRLAAELRALRGQVAELIRTTAAVPAATGAHVGGAISGAAGAAGFRNRYPQGGW